MPAKLGKIPILLNRRTISFMLALDASLRMHGGLGEWLNPLAWKASLPVKR
jgi:hypothetical protein